MKVKKFFDEKFIQFSRYDCVRSIPKLTDGFKPSQRKCIYGNQQRGENAGEIQVERLAAFIGSESQYHHGVGSLESTLVGMAQDFAGANNVPLFEANGQFGSRLSPDAAASRYIFTKFSSNFRKLFKKEDDIILKYQEEDGHRIEPETYIPILPTILINGGQGVGTGYASLILSYDPEVLKKYTLELLYGNVPEFSILPYFKGFKGTVERNENQTIITGKIEVVNATTLKITELPVGTYLDSYKTVLNKLEDAGTIRSYDDLSTEDGFEFVIYTFKNITSLPEEELLKKFKLISRVTENLTLWNADNKIQEFGSIEHILTEFILWRLSRYEERRQKLIANSDLDLVWLNEKLRFVLFYLKNSKEFTNKPKKELFDYLEQNKFVETDKLLRLPIYTLTHDEIEKLKEEIKNVQDYIASLQATNAEEMYIKELKELKL